MSLRVVLLGCVCCVALCCGILFHMSYVFCCDVVVWYVWCIVLVCYCCVYVCYVCIIDVVAVLLYVLMCCMVVL